MVTNLSLKMSLKCCLHIPGLRRLDDHFICRGFLWFPRMARFPRPDRRALRSCLLTLVFSVRLLLFPAGLAEATRDPDLWLLVPAFVLVISRPS